MAMAMGLLSVSSMAHPPPQSQHLSFSRTETLSTASATAPSALSLSSFSSSLSLPLTGTAAPLQSLPFPFPSVYCGRGDKKTAKGKRFKHSFGNARPRDKKKGRGPPRVSAPPAPPKKDKFDDGEIIKIEIDESFVS